MSRSSSVVWCAALVLVGGVVLGVSCGQVSVATPVLSPRADGSLVLVDGESGAEIAALYAPKEAERLEVSALNWTPTARLSPDGGVIVSARGDESPLLWRLVDGVWTAATLSSGPIVVLEVAFSDDGAHVGVIGKDSKAPGHGGLTIWDVATLAPVVDESDDALEFESLDIRGKRAWAKIRNVKTGGAATVREWTLP